MPEFVKRVAEDLVASGIGTGLYSTSGVSVQVNYRRDLGTDHVVLLTQTGGVAFAWNFKEQQAFQVLVDSVDLVSAQTLARQVFDQLHERTATCFSGYEVLWLRAVAPPQAIPVGPQADQPSRFQFSVNFDALLVKA